MDREFERQLLVARGIDSTCVEIEQNLTNLEILTEKIDAYTTLAAAQTRRFKDAQKARVVLPLSISIDIRVRVWLYLCYAKTRNVFISSCVHVSLCR